MEATSNLKVALISFDHAIAAALADGGKKAFAQKKKCRHVLKPTFARIIGICPYERAFVPDARHVTERKELSASDACHAAREKNCRDQTHVTRLAKGIDGGRRASRGH